MRLFDKAGAEDPFAGRESKRFEINQRVLTNTVEQGAVFVLLLLALATRISAGALEAPARRGHRLVQRDACSSGPATTSRRTGARRASTGRILTTSLVAGWFVSTLILTHSANHDTSRSDRR